MTNEEKIDYFQDELQEARWALEEAEGNVQLAEEGEHPEELDPNEARWVLEEAQERLDEAILHLKQLGITATR